MPTGSSSSRPPRKPTRSVRSPPEETDKIHDGKWCSNTFSRRHRCILSKASGLREHIRVPVAVILFSPAGELKCFGWPLIEEVFLMYLRHQCGLMPPMNAEAEKECESCLKKEDCATPIKKYLDPVVLLLKKLVSFKNDPPFLRPVRPLSRRKRQTGSSSFQRSCSNMFSKRSNCILDKASELRELTGASVAIIMFSPAGNLKRFGRPSIEEVFLRYLLHQYDVELGILQNEDGEPVPAQMSFVETDLSGISKVMSPKEGVTEEDCASLIINYLDPVIPLLKKLKDFESKPSVNAGAGHESGVGAGRDPEGLTVDNTNAADHEPGVRADWDPADWVDEIIPLIDKFGASEPEAYYDIFHKYYFAPGRSDWAASGESSGVDSNSMGFNPDDYIRTPSSSEED